MIIGHEVPGGERVVSRLIFSFHMPLFFILSGYTSRPIVTFSYFQKKIKKSVLNIWLLAAVIVFVYCVECLIFQPNFTLAAMIKQFVLGIFWGCNKLPITNVTGTMWFMFAFFWSKLLYDLLQLFVPNKYNGFILLILAFISFVFHKWLPQVIDLAPYGALFMWLGWYMKVVIQKYQRSSNQARIVALSMVAIYWLTLVIKGVYIDMSVRHFPLFIVSILEAFAGTIVICKFSAFIQNEGCANWLKIIGRYTLSILCIHQLDLYWVIWAKYFPRWYVAVIIRLIVDMVIFLVYLYLYRGFIINRSKD